MSTFLSILVSTSLAGILFCLLKLHYVNKVRKINVAEPIANKKWRRFLIGVICLCSLSFIVGVALFFFLS